MYSKTLGNAFFVTQFLHSLYEDGWLSFDHSHRRWIWDFEQIQSADITDNVVELMVNKIRKLSSSTQAVLRLAACVGNTFDLHTLSMICEKSAQETLKELLTAIQEGLIVPLDQRFRLAAMGFDSDNADPVRFNFVHDRVEQAAYSFIETAQRPALHLRIGRVLVSKISEADIEERIFDLVHHVNLGSDLVNTPEERLHLAELNLLAAQKARTATAYAPALNYAAFGLTLLPEDGWQSCYRLTLHLHEEAAESAYLSGDFSQMNRAFETVVHHARSPLDMVTVYKVNIEALKAQADLTGAIQTGLHLLKRLGITFPKKPAKIHVILALLRLKLLLAGKHPNDYIDLPDMTDPYKLAALEILLCIGSAAHFGAPDLLPLLVFEDVSLSVQYGNTPAASFNYATYAFSLCGILGDIDAGYQFSQLALQVLQRFRYNTFKAKTLFMVNFFVTHWKEHAANTLQPLLEAYHSGLEIGDFEYAGFGLSAYIRYALFLGNDLAELERLISVHHPMMRQVKQETSFYNIALYHQAVVNLKDGGGPHQEEMPPHVKQNQTVMMNVSFFPLMRCYLFRNFPRACEHADNGEAYLEGARGSLSLPLYHFYASLTRLAVIPNASSAARRSLLRKVRASQKHLKKWARHAPMNHLHKWQLVEAERCRVTGKPGKAARLYDQAIDNARTQGYVNEEALACELAGQFYLEQQRPRFARLYLKEARDAYQHWGALAKVKDLEQRYAQYVADAPQPSGTSNGATSHGTTFGQSEALDVASVIKASQMLSEEIQLDRLLQRLLKFVIENAGAERGVLILPHDEIWAMRAEGHVEQDQIVTNVTASQNLEGIVSSGIVNYVVRSQEAVVLHDAMHQEMFAHDPYVMAHQVKSVLCLPLIKQGKLTSVVYLENNTSTNVFITDRIAILTLLSSQAAISIENAALYDTLEHKVAERTQQLAEAKEKAESANRAKSTFLSNMNHELRTPLNAVLGFTQLLAHAPHSAEEKNYLDIIQRSGEHLLSLINQVLDFSKIEAGRLTLEQTEFDLSQLLVDLENMFRLRVEKKGLTLRIESDPDIPRDVIGDEMKLKQVLINLLGNAIKFTEHGGITVRVKGERSKDKGARTKGQGQRGEERGTRNKEQGARPKDFSSHLYPSSSLLSPLSFGIQFEIEDTGPGIASEELNMIFEAFGQSATGRQAREGTGLGLAISRKFVRLMGGDLRVSSKVGVGSTFNFDLIMKAADQISPDKLQPPLRRPPMALEAGQPHFRILVVDNNSVNRRLLTSLLAPFEFDLREAENGQEAVDIWHNWQPHCIWMDVQMPVMNGYEATEAIRKFEIQNSKFEIHTVIIALSASSFKEERDAALSQGCDDFLRKPFQEADVFALLQQHLGVKFVYADAETDGTRSVSAGKSAKEEAANLHDVPEDLIFALTEATQGLNIGTMHEIIARIQTHNAPLAETLDHLAHEFEYVEILTLLEQR